MDSSINEILNTSRTLAHAADNLKFGGKVNHIYNPLRYAAETHEYYIRRYASGKKRALFLGMNPGPWGMAQTGIPFGEISYTRDWLKIEGNIHQPKTSHPKRPVQGWECRRSEVSGRRLWGLMETRFGNADNFFKDNYVENYCPLIFMEETGKNLTPDELSPGERDLLTHICDIHLKKVILILEPEYLVGIGKYAEKNLKRVAASLEKKDRYTITSILHPSPANPHANRGWADAVTQQLIEQGIWS